MADERKCCSSSLSLWVSFLFRLQVSYQTTQKVAAYVPEIIWKNFDGYLWLHFVVFQLTH